MTNGRATARNIAREIIADIASDWPVVSTSRCIKKGNQYIFEFVLGRPLYTILSKPQALKSGDSVVRFNPLPQATVIVWNLIQKLANNQDMDSEMRDYIVRRDAKLQINEMLELAPRVFSDAAWQSSILAEATCTMRVLNTFGKSDFSRNVAALALDLIRDMLKERLPRVSQTRNLKINEFTISTALKQFLPKFKSTRELPSQRQFAKAVGVTPKAWRRFLSNHSLDKHEITIRAWYEFMLAKESDPNKAGDFPFTT